MTLPSHTTILTGRLPYDHGMRDNSGFRVRDGTATLATMLKPLGFATGAFVGGFPVSKRFGLTPGFDVYDDQLPEMKGEVNFALPERRADVVVSRAEEWIGKQTGKFFAWVHAFDPHSPYRRVDDSPPRRTCCLWRDFRDDERHVERRFVSEHPVRLLTMLAEALAVVGCDDDQRGP